ncbi:baculoviral IAP repeat-containing protein 7 [Biomphalaria pfeifferi]|uniref:Baculoviral IAP repeat-containing protein 7 n=1 Tax=Biomphalaria pfeifferi TaxID=112525 RepID=A0AAD8C2U7_BIOPF|nr:baculoviral IAP repeat-containing protein 7 [Biomphalaria pfeifferi]
MTSAFDTMSYYRRLSSYRAIVESNVTGYCIWLAQLGFLYTGQNLELQCEGCSVLVQIHADWSVTRSRLRHKGGCVFDISLKSFLDYGNRLTRGSSQDDSYLISEASGDSISDVSSSSANPQMGVNQIESSNEAIATCPSTTSSELSRDIAAVSKKDEQCCLSDTSSLGHTFTDCSPQYRLDDRSTLSASPVSALVKSDLATEYIEFPELFRSECCVLNSSDDKHNFTSISRDCDKNPGHFAYFNVSTLQLQHIPSRFRCPEMLRLLTLMGELTARLTVSSTSREKRQTEVGHHMVRVGTGFVIEHKCQMTMSSQKELKSKLKTIKERFTKGSKKSVGTVYIQTSRHLVYNAEEARKTDVEFFYDSADRKDIVTLKGKYVSTPGDGQCLLACECSDLGFIQKLNQLQTEFFQAAEALPRKVKKGMLKKMFMVHHPHGGPKVLSYGDFVKVKYSYNSGEANKQPTLTKLNPHDEVEQDVSLYRKSLFYATDTCPGSSGSPILTFVPVMRHDCVTLLPNLSIHNGVETGHKLGASILKMCTVEDFYQPPPQSEHPEESSDDDCSLAKQPVNSPVYKVITTPSYPEHVMFQTRLKSFDSWNFHNILQPQTLASLGFFYTGDLDCVRCFQCGLGLRSWKPGDDVLAQHEKYRPTCPYLRSLLKTQENVSTGAFAVPEMSNSDIESTTLKLLKAEHTALKQQLTCKVCYKSEIKDVFLPCGELYPTVTVQNF